jgi:hypothetical protein
MTTRSVLLLLFVLSAVTVRGQEKIAPPPRESVPVDSASVKESEPLPAIDLPEYQITGDARIDLPEFGKSPAPDDGGLDPLLGDAGAATRDPAEFQTGSPKVQQDFDSMQSGLNGRLTAGYGSFNTPFFDGWFGRAAGDTRVLLKAGYLSSDGHVAHAGHRNGSAELSAGWTVPGTSGVVPGADVDAKFGMKGDSYNLYGSQTPDRRRTVNRFRGDLTLGSATGAPFRYAGGAHLHGVTMNDSLRSRSTSLGFDLTGGAEAGSVRLKGTAEFWADFLDAPGAVTNPLFFHAGVGATVPVTGSIDINGGLGIYALRSSDDFSRFRVAPALGVSWFAADGLTLFARFDPGVERRTLGTLVETNPYLRDGSIIRHEERPVFLTGGAEVDLAARIRGRVALEYVRARNAVLFLDEFPEEGTWYAAYGGITRTVALRCDVRAEIDSRQTLSTSFVFQGARNSATDASPTYLPTVIIGGTYTYRFPFGLNAGTVATVVGKQTTDRWAVETLPAFVLVDVNLSYVITGALTVQGSLQNLFNPSCRWWKGYRAPSRGAAVSLSHSW